ncbi:DUF72 domain-containing protein [Amycolatopsis alkalitolerans]|uniref:DUF72 domain-containing protein n=1 Tax=Amycolatopsis alkalitolerans TaxID=2547244 RepID=A0A5C4M7T0_9PSEU|nr:DUF72 domain-containing protein [Amycolatopsis alkalitolerans]TNC28111.1 DUF72 domain-containing protein [Amycolatopsis alkalitolerans]
MGTSGWRYPAWRGTFYPRGLAQRRELEYLSARMNTAEINGSFYSLQRPERYRAWSAQTPEGFVFAVKGGRFITHMKRLVGVEVPLANFFASGVLALGHKLGPILWQLPPTLAFEPGRLANFFALLPRTTRAAAELAKKHDDKVKGEPHTDAGPDRPLRYALEVRHPSFQTAEFPELLRDNGIASVVSDSASTWLTLEEVTADFVYVRLHGAEELYASGYSDVALRSWAGKIRAWQAGRRDAYVYFDNDAEVRAPHDAIALAALMA